MSDQKKNWVPGRTWGIDPGATTATAKRRGSRIVHDDRGNARLEWIEESADRLLTDRVTLEIVEDGLDSRGVPAARNPHKAQAGWNPYQAVGTSKSDSAARGTGSTSRTDLRKLSEWIKLKRAMEQRKLQSDATED